MEHRAQEVYFPNQGIQKGTKVGFPLILNIPYLLLRISWAVVVLPENPSLTTPSPGARVAAIYLCL